MKKKVLFSMFALLTFVGLAYAVVENQTFALEFGGDAKLVKAWRTQGPEQIAEKLGYTGVKNGAKIQDKIVDYVTRLDRVDVKAEEGFIQADIDRMKLNANEAWNFIAIDIYKRKYGELYREFNSQFGEGTLWDRDPVEIKTALDALKDIDKAKLKNNKKVKEYLPKMEEALTTHYYALLSMKAYDVLGRSYIAGFKLGPWYKADTKANSDYQNYLNLKEAWNHLKGMTDTTNPAYASKVKAEEHLSGQVDAYLTEGDKMDAAVKYLKNGNPQVNRYFQDGNILDDADIVYKDCKNLCQIKKDIAAKTDEEGKKYILQVWPESYLNHQVDVANQAYKAAYPAQKAIELAQQFVTKYQAKGILLTKPEDVAVEDIPTDAKYITTGTRCQLEAIDEAIAEYRGIYDEEEMTTNIADEDGLNGGPLKYNDLKAWWNCTHMDIAVPNAEPYNVVLDIAKDVKDILSNPQRGIVNDANPKDVYTVLRALKKTAMIDYYAFEAASAYIEVYDDMIKRTTYNHEIQVVRTDLQKLEDAIADYNKMWAYGATPALKEALAAHDMGVFKFYYWNSKLVDIVKPESTPAANKVPASEEYDAANGITNTGKAILAQAKAYIDAYMYGGEDCEGEIKAQANNDVKNGRGEKNEEGYNYGTFKAKRDAADWLQTYEVNRETTLADNTTVNWDINMTRGEGYAVNAFDVMVLKEAMADYQELSAEAKEYIDSAYYFNAYKDIIPDNVEKIFLISHCFDSWEEQVFTPGEPRGAEALVSINKVKEILEEAQIKELDFNKRGTNAYVIFYGARLDRDNFVGYDKLPANFVVAGPAVDETGATTTRIVQTADVFKLEVNAPYKFYKNINVDEMVVTRNIGTAGERVCLYLPFRVEQENYDAVEEQLSGIYAIGGAYVDDVNKKIAFGISRKGSKDNGSGFYGDRFLAAYKPYIVTAAKEQIGKEIKLNDITVLPTNQQDSLVVNVLNRVQFQFTSSNDMSIIKIGEYYLAKDVLYPNKTVEKLTSPAGTLKLTVLNEAMQDYVIGFEADLDEATGIQNVNATENQNGAIYNINGQKVNTMNRPGIYVVNGKKVSVK